MTPIASKLKPTIEDAVARLIARAEDSRGLKLEDVEPRVSRSVEKYLLKDKENADHADVIDFVDSLRADDLCLIIACEKGDENAWGDIVLNFDSSVKSAAFKFAKNKEDAEDLAGSIWAELHGLKLDAEGKTKGKLSYYSGKGSLAGWLRAVTNQLAIDQFRKMKRIVQAEDDREFEILAQDSAEKSDGKSIVTSTENPEEIFGTAEAEKDVVAALHSAIADLEDEDRLIMKLYYFEGLKLKEIAATFGYHEATASRKIVRVQKAIRGGVEKKLKEKHGWNESEVKKYLTDIAENLGLNLEKLFTIAIVFVFVQEIASSGVL
ncbi:MAG: sigma-70 family RNA polymerase sigma factor [Pyrinomonadaceae bacterium]|nr:sigma-70 family RNA polymerase sigma factor [Pyrinomonadaceae bacterium]